VPFQATRNGKSSPSSGDIHVLFFGSLHFFSVSHSNFAVVLKQLLWIQNPGLEVLNVQVFNFIGYIFLRRGGTTLVAVLWLKTN
jgi:hypothetical protein